MSLDSSRGHSNLKKKWGKKGKERIINFEGKEKKKIENGYTCTSNSKTRGFEKILQESSSPPDALALSLGRLMNPHVLYIPERRGDGVDLDKVQIKNLREKKIGNFYL